MAASKFRVLSDSEVSPSATSKRAWATMSPSSMPEVIMCQVMP